MFQKEFWHPLPWWCHSGHVLLLPSSSPSNHPPSGQTVQGEPMFHSESIDTYSRYVSTKFHVLPFDTPCPRLWTLLGIAAQTRVCTETWSQHQCTCAHLLYIWTVWGLEKGVWMGETWNLVQTCFGYAQMDFEWNIGSPCTAWPGGGWFEGEEEGRRRTWSLWHHQGREC